MNCLRWLSLVQSIVVGALGCANAVVDENASVAGAGAGSSTGVPEGSHSSTSTGGTTTATSGAGGGDSGPTRVRFLQMTPSLPELDVCFGTRIGDGAPQFQGPLLENAGVGTGLGFPSMSGYSEITLGQGGAEHLVRIVKPHATCEDAIESANGYPLMADAPLYDAALGGSFTIALFLAPGKGVDLLHAIPLPEAEPTDAPSSGSKLRIVNTTISPIYELDVSASLGGQPPAPLFTGLTLGAIPETSAAGAVDDEGFVTLAAASLGAVTLSPSSAPADAVVVPGGFTLDAIDSLYLVGAWNSDTTPIRMLACPGDGDCELYGP